MPEAEAKKHLALYHERSIRESAAGIKPSGNVCKKIAPLQIVSAASAISWGKWTARHLRKDMLHPAVNCRGHREPRPCRIMMNDETDDFEDSKLLAQVHDSLLVEHTTRDYARMARFAIKLGREYMRPELNYGEPFRLNTTLKAGFDWGHMTEIEGFSDEVEPLAIKLEAVAAKFYSSRRAAQAAA